MKRPTCIAYISKNLLDREVEKLFGDRKRSVWQWFGQYISFNGVCTVNASSDHHQKTDHQPLIYLNKSKIRNSTLMRLALQLHDLPLHH